MRIYELLKQWSTIKKNISYKVDLLKELLGLEEIIERKDGKEKIINKSYRNFGLFEKRIIIPAVNEINEKSEINVTYTKEKEGRKVVGITFHVKLKEYL